MNLLPFLALTFGISLAGFAVIATWPAARSPERPAGLPFWLLMVWGPSLAALIMAARADEAGALLGRVVAFSTVPPVVWLLVISPLLLLLALRPAAPDAPSPLGLRMALAMVGFNLILGPLGEELGWRGTLQDALAPGLGWLLASLTVGVVWFIWHLPLWFIPSPHAAIPLPLFGLHCLAYAVLIGAAHHMTDGSLAPAILLHLTVNLAANWAIFAGYTAPDAWFRRSLLPYLALAGGAALLAWLT